METSSAAVALLQGELLPQSSRPLLQANAWNATLRKEPESRNLNQDSRSHWDQVPAGLKWSFIAPKKLFPPLGHYAIDFYAQKKQLLCNSLFIFYCTQEEEKSSFQKWLFKIYIQEKNCAVATQELNKHHTVTPMDGLHFSFTSQHRKTYFSSSWLFNPSFCSKWIRLGFNQFLFGPNSFRHTGKFNIEQNTEVKRSNNTSKELFPLCQQHSAADPSKYERLNEEG